MTENYITTIENATMKLIQLDEGIGPIEVETTRESPGIFVADAALSLQGIWSVYVEGQTSEPGVPNIIAVFDDVFVKPKISNIVSNITEYKTPDQSLPLYPIYDESRQSIWVGDSMPETGRIWQFNIASKNYTEHLIDNVSLITVTALDPEGNIWYIDPTKSILGKYDVGNKQNTHFNIPEEGIISGLAIDNNQNLWMSVVQANIIVKFNSTNQTFTSYNIPTPNALPGTITFDREANSIWFTEGIGKIAKINPETGNITEFAPTTSLLLSSSQDNPLEEPTMVFSDPKTFDIYITEHEGNRITAYNQFLDTFNEYPIVNDQGLPFGMAMDKFGNLWFAQHVIDKIAVLDPRTGESIEVDVPINGSFIQYLTSDNDGNIWFAAQRASSIGNIITSPGPPSSGVGTSTSTEAVASTVKTQEQQQEGEKVGGFAGVVISYFGLSFTDILGPLLAGGIILAALFYSKTLIDLKHNMAVVTKSNKRT
jgi:copper transport protein